MKKSRDFFSSDATVIASLFILSLFVPLLFFQQGFFSPDEREYTYLSENLLERQSLDVGHRFPAWEETHSTLALPRGFLVSPHNPDVVHAACFFGYSLVAAPVVAVVGIQGMALFNVFVTAATVVLVYLLGRLLWPTGYAPLIAALLYLVASPALFFATSYWYHPLINGSFLACVYLFLKASRPHDDILFFVAAAICVWTAYYMLLPVGVLMLFRANREHGWVRRLGILVVFGALLLPNFIYNEIVYDAMFTGYLGGSLAPSEDTLSGSLLGLVWHGVTLVFYGVTGFFLCRICAAFAYPHFSYMQKALLESSPFLIAAVPGYMLIRERLATSRWRAVLAAHLLYIVMIIWGKTNSFGGWTLTARYMLPIVPLLIVLASGYLIRVCQPTWLVLVMAVVAAGTFIIPLPHPALVWGIQSGTSLVLLLFGIHALLTARATKGSQTLYISLILYLAVGAGVMNAVFDARFGSSVRENSLIITQAMDDVVPAGAAVLVPKELYFDFAEYPRHRVIWYLPYSDPRRAAVHVDLAPDINAVINHYHAQELPVYLVVNADQGLAANLCAAIRQLYAFEQTGTLDTPYAKGEVYRVSPK